MNAENLRQTDFPKLCTFALLAPKAAQHLKFHMELIFNGPSKKNGYIIFKYLCWGAAAFGDRNQLGHHRHKSVGKYIKVLCRNPPSMT